MTIVSILKANYSEIDMERLLAPLGGMGRFVEKDEKVLLKPNLLSAKGPEKAVNTHPSMVRVVAQAVKKAGGCPYLGDSPAGTFSQRVLKKTYKRSGFEKLATQEDLPLNLKTGSTKVDIPDGHRLHRVPICEYAIEAQKIIALPKLKTHSFQYLTLACKIMYGAVPGLTKAKYHAQFPRKISFADMMLDVLSVVKPHVIIMDAIIAMQGQGPGNGDPIKLGLVLAATDCVALDITVCRIIGVEPVGIPVLKRAKVRGMWPGNIEYPLLRPQDVAYHGFRLPNTADHLLTGRKTPSKSPVVTAKCIACGDCQNICPKKAIIVEGDLAVVTYSKCIRCYCCHEICPEDAIVLRGLK